MIQKGIKEVNSVVSHQAHFHHRWHYSYYMWLFLALVNSSRTGLWQVWEGAMDFITYAVKNSSLNLMKSLCFPRLQKITPVTQELAGRDLAKF